LAMEIRTPTCYDRRRMIDRLPHWLKGLFAIVGIV
jgi:hypothetical protein